MQSSDFLLFFGLIRRAGRLAIGIENAAAACQSGKARLVVLAGDASEGSLSPLKRLCLEKEVLTVSPGFGKAELGGALGIGECSAAAVTDTSLAIGVCRKLGLKEHAARLEIKLEREKRRKAKKMAKISKRGK